MRVQTDKPVIHPALGRTPEEREAALRDLLAMAGKGYRSEGRKMARDEMHERGPAPSD